MEHAVDIERYCSELISSALDVMKTHTSHTSIDRMKTDE